MKKIINKKLYLRKSIIISLIGILLANLMGFFILKNYRDLRDALVTSEQKHLLTIADTTAKNIEAYFKAEERAIDILIQDSIFQKEFEALLLTKKKPAADSSLKMYYKIEFPRVDSVKLLNLNGDILSEYPIKLSNQKKSRHINKIKDIQKEGKTIVTKVYFDQEEPHVYILKPIRIKNKIKGIISCRLNINYIYDTFIKTIKSGSKGYASVKDKSGVFIMHPSKEEVSKNVLNIRTSRFPQYDWSELASLFDKQMSGKKGVEIYHSVWVTDKKPTRTKKFNGYAPAFISDDFWIITVSADYNEVVSVIKKNYYYTVIIAFIIVLSIISSIVYTYIIREKKKKLEIKTLYINEVTKLNRELEEDIKQRKILESELKMKLKENREKEVLLISQSRYAAMGEMIANIAHQWRQPLSTLALILSNIEDSLKYNDMTKEEMFQLFKKSKLIINKMSETIEDFKDFFNPKTRKDIFSILHCIKATIELNSERLKHNSIELNLNYDKNVKINGYENQLSQVILNLINNSIDALIEKKKETKIINISILQKYINGLPTTIIEINDNGGGISDEIKQKIFEPYFSTKNKKNGTGLGLYMSKMIIEKNFDGTIEVDNKNEGANFMLYFPQDN